MISRKVATAALIVNEVVERETKRVKGVRVTNLTNRVRGKTR